MLVIIKARILIQIRLTVAPLVSLLTHVTSPCEAMMNV